MSTLPKGILVRHEPSALQKELRWVMFWQKGQVISKKKKKEKERKKKKKKKKKYRISSKWKIVNLC